jgi:hypothetical protein
MVEGVENAAPDLRRIIGDLQRRNSALTQRGRSGIILAAQGRYWLASKVMQTVILRHFSSIKGQVYDTADPR